MIKNGRIARWPMDRPAIRPILTIQTIVGLYRL